MKGDCIKKLVVNSLDLVVINNFYCNVVNFFPIMYPFNILFTRRFLIGNLIIASALSVSSYFIFKFIVTKIYEKEDYKTKN